LWFLCGEVHVILWNLGRRYLRLRRVNIFLWKLEIKYLKLIKVNMFPWKLERECPSLRREKKILIMINTILKKLNERCSLHGGGGS
jgi:hypothetical protein